MTAKILPFPSKPAPAPAPSADVRQFTDTLRGMVAGAAWSPRLPPAWAAWVEATERLIGEIEKARARPPLCGHWRCADAWWETREGGCRQ